MTTVAIYDDHPIICNSVSNYFKPDKYISVLGSFTKSKDLFAFLLHNKIDILIADILTDEFNDLSLFSSVFTKFPEIKIIAFSQLKSDFLKNELFNMGISAFVNKAHELHHLRETILSTSEVCHPNTCKSKYKLSAKEKLIAEYLLQGNLSKEIAQKTKSSISTINNQKNKMIKKFECNNSTELVGKLIQLGFVKVL